MRMSIINQCDITEFGQRVDLMVYELCDSEEIEYSSIEFKTAHASTKLLDYHDISANSAHPLDGPDLCRLRESILEVAKLSIKNSKIFDYRAEQNVLCVNTEHIQTLPYQMQASGKVEK
ncbi:unnamed protein product [Mucor fragilis]